MTTVEKEWQDYSRRVMPPGAPDVQRQEMRRSFWAGFYAMLCVCKWVGETGMTENEGAMFLERLDEECREYYRRMREGRE